MTVINDVNPLSGCGNLTTTQHCNNNLLGINCGSPNVSSEVSIDQNMASSSNLEKNSIKEVNNFKIDFDTKFSRCKKVDIEFENIKYAVSKFSFSETKFVHKEILHGISGAFRSGELTAIMGPSGAGKSTLLNVMSGFSVTGVTGTIRVNGKEMTSNSRKYSQLSCYVHQDDLLRPQLMVGEVMMLVAHLKLGFKISRQQKLNLVKQILVFLGLEHRFNVFTSKLSGGQKKRLSIALELISNPPVIYLDEPTTGLDSLSCSKCIGLLKKLASHGHTIVFTIHQPSALIFDMFDKLYTVVEGHCMYQGPTKELLPFLADQNLFCPTYHNPADFLLEVASGDYERDLEKLINAASKKYFEQSDSQMNHVSRLLSNIEADNIDLTSCNLEIGSKLHKILNKASGSLQLPTFDYVKATVDELSLEEMKGLNVTDSIAASQQHRKLPKSELLKADSFSMNDIDDKKFSKVSFFMQYLLLLQRIFICSKRNYFLLMARIFVHVFIGIIFGYLYINIAEKASTVLGNYVYLYGSILLLVYTGKMAVVLTFPLEIGMLSREHFNRWYNLGPYFLSLLSFEIPFQIICAVLYMSISIYLTSNDNSEGFRICYLVMFGVLSTLSAQAWGFFVGATLPIKLAVFLGPILAVLLSVFGFCSRYIDITPLFRWMWHISYFRAGFHGSLNAIYGMDREFLPCPENLIYCHFRSPKVFLNYMMITDESITHSVLLLVSVIGIMHILTILRLWYKLNKR